MDGNTRGGGRAAERGKGEGLLSLTCVLSLKLADIARQKDCNQSKQIIDVVKRLLSGGGGQEISQSLT